jgi:hypothetical protein
MSWRRAERAAVVAAAILTLVFAACIIADPPTDLPRPATRKPSIFQAGAQPSNAKVLGFWPDGFIVEVDADPVMSLEWRLFIDYDPSTGRGFVGRNTVPGTPGSPDAAVRSFKMQPNDLTAPDPTRCHVIEGLVAYHYFDPPPIQNEHAFERNLGDTIVWFYSPTGDLSGCPVIHSALDGSFSDAEAGTILFGDGGTD